MPLPLLLAAGLGDLLEAVADAPAPAHAADADHGDDGADDDAGADDDDADDDDDDDDDDDAPFVTATARLHLDGRLGASVGNVLLVPFVVPGPAVGGELTGQLVFVEHIVVGADVAVSFGVATDRSDPAPLAGYKGRLRLGLVADADRLVLSGDVHAGISSIALLPLPRVGVGGAATFRLYRGEVFTWDLKADADLDVVIIAPSPGLGLSTGVSWRVGCAEFGARVGVEGDAVVAVVVNTAGAAVFVNAWAGGRF